MGRELYATRIGLISERNSDLERAVWTKGIYFDRLGGQFAIPRILSAGR